MMTVPALATVTQTSPSPADNATGLVPRDTTTFSVSLATNGTHMNGTITCVNTGDVKTISSQLNGTQTLTFANPLAIQTTYQVWANVSDDWSWTNTSYNFTTGNAQLLSDNSNNLITIIIVELVIVFIALALIYYTVNNFMQSKKKGIKEMMELIKVLFIGLIILTIVALIVSTF